MAGSETSSRGRHIAVWVLVVVATLLMLVMSLTTWVNRQMLDNDAWTHASRQIVVDDKVQSALSAYLVNQLYDNVDVAAALRERLPANLDRLAGPLAGALREPAANAAERMLARPRVQELFVQTSSRAHQRLVNVLENKTGFGISTGNGLVTLDLDALVVELATEMGLPESAIAKIPADTAVVTVMRSDQLGAAQKLVRAIHALSLWLLVIVLALYVAAVALARGARRTTLRNIGWAFIFVGLVDLLVRRVTGNYAIGALTEPQYRGTVRDVWLIGSSILGQIGRAAILYGVVTVAAAVLAGSTGPALSLRGSLAPVLNRRPGAVWASVGFVYLLLVVWGPTYALRTWWGVLLFAALIAIGLVALRRQTLAESSDGPPPPNGHPRLRRLVQGAPRGEGAGARDWRGGARREWGGRAVSPAPAGPERSAW